MSTTQVFHGRTLAEAEAAAISALGVDADIVMTRKIPRRGLRGMLGGADFEVAATPPPPAPTSAPPSPRRDAGPFSEAAHRFEKGGSDEIAALRAELKGEIRVMRSILSRGSSMAPGIETQLAELRDVLERIATSDAPVAPRTTRLGRLFAGLGLEGRVAQTVSRRVKELAQRTPTAPDGPSDEELLREALADVAAVAPWPLAGHGKKLVALVGPSGVGKTTTAAKLAARAVLDGGLTVTFVCTDGFRVGAAAQLERYAELLGARFVLAQDADELRAAIADAKTDLVVVDTAGHGAPEGMDAALASLPPTSPMARHVLLCLPAALRAVDAERFARCYAPVAPTGVCITKIDETSAPVGLVHGAAAARLPLVAFCFGQRVPEDVAPATAGALLDYLVPPPSARARKTTLVAGAPVPRRTAKPSTTTVHS